MGALKATIQFTIAEPLMPGVAVEIQASADLLSWTTVASKRGSEEWSGTAEVLVSGVEDQAGQVSVSVTPALDLAEERFQFFRASITSD